MRQTPEEQYIAALQQENKHLRNGITQLKHEARYAAQFHADELTVPQVFKALDTTLTMILEG
ncbi:hypothetical protein QP999_02965 [Corynebacterium sp. MSK004]|uniref:hypothetical protein n=1 Tax=Corynebacterium sp. MSK004 TaxID=3050186 RepID=UPI0025503132|nr:hypothetical protein [Corynebacterium sp. MSK004]MDK8896903.1 hypothetical protein [Corynebacterium sp. MSK004]